MATSPGRILIADDQQDVLEALRLFFKGEGYQTETVTSPRAALEALRVNDYDLLLMDLNYTRDTTSGKEGLELLQQVRALDDRLPVVVMTAWSSVELAVSAMQHGAGDFLEKPWSNERLLSIVRNQIKLGRAQKNSQRLEAAQRLQLGDGTPDLIAESPSMQPVLDVISRVAPSDAAILITGENGTGKGLVARAIHAISERRTKSLVSVNMGGISENLFESELFGHVKGAFTDAKSDRMGRLEMAEGGTLFLDEIANMPLAQQAKMLRVLETNEYERVGSSKTKQANVRFISATNADVEAEVEAGQFRRDLLFRLNTVEIKLPALRDRAEDVEPLANFFLGLHQQKHRRSPTGFHPDSIELMKRHDWPGNVRELSHSVERALLMASGDLIRPADLGLQASKDGGASLDDMSLEEVERYLIKRTLSRCNGSALEAAKALGLSRSAFYRRLEKYGL